MSRPSCPVPGWVAERRESGSPRWGQGPHVVVGSSRGRKFGPGLAGESGHEEVDGCFGGATNFRDRVPGLDLLQGIQVCLGRMLPEESQCFDTPLGIRVLAGRGEGLLEVAVDRTLADVRGSVASEWLRRGVRGKDRGRGPRWVGPGTSGLRASAGNDSCCRRFLVEPWLPRIEARRDQADHSEGDNGDLRCTHARFRWGLGTGRSSQHSSPWRAAASLLHGLALSYAGCLRAWTST
jgi:hypothetical protein